MPAIRTILNASNLSRGIASILLISQLSACGTILYPERRGQVSGEIDVGVVALNALGLLFFFVPGVIAFGVDFATGAIYLPGGETASLSKDELDQVKSGSGNIDLKKFKTLIAKRSDLGLSNQVDLSQLKVVSMSSEQMLKQAVNSPAQQVAMYSPKY